MNIKTTISISEARKRLFEVAEEVQSPQTVFTFTEKGRPKVVMMSAENFESWAETLEVMSLFPQLKKDLRETKQAIKDKSYKKWATFESVFPTTKTVKAKAKKLRAPSK
ncbi:MAG: type II toxin-antitoxin system Phd/YefM family antitoxin [Candidatus Kaiserbacteria bacterium]|nr:type II toxin-antitoxin system Phd/YefM family antitoxin [Candidatus Kaiserbacteria bacterium]